MSICKKVLYILFCLSIAQFLISCGENDFTGTLPLPDSIDSDSENFKLTKISDTEIKITWTNSYYASAHVIYRNNVAISTITKSLHTEGDGEYIDSSFSTSSVKLSYYIVAYNEKGYSEPSKNESITLGINKNPFALLSSQYKPTGNSFDPWFESKEKGNIYSFSNNFNYSWGLGECCNLYEQRQAYGLQFENTKEVVNTDYFGLSFNVPNNEALNISSSTKMVIQMGNGSWSSTSTADPNLKAYPDSHMVFTVDLQSDGKIRCSYNQSLIPNSQPNNNPEKWVNLYGIHTYEIPLNQFSDCDNGGINDILPNLRSVAVKVVGGNDVTASKTFPNQTLIQVGWIGFSHNDYQEDFIKGNYLLYASQYQYLNFENSTQLKTFEKGDVSYYSKGDFTELYVFDNDDISFKQGFGVDYGHTPTIDSNSEFAISINPPYNTIADISSNTTMVIQVGNGTWSTDSPSNPEIIAYSSSHLVITLSLNSGSFDNINKRWTSSCSYDLTLEDKTRPNSAPATGINPLGLHTYEISLADFNQCNNEPQNIVRQFVQNLSVKIVGGKDENASNTTNNRALLQVGWIAFK